MADRVSKIKGKPRSFKANCADHCILLLNHLSVNNNNNNSCIYVAFNTRFLSAVSVTDKCKNRRHNSTLDDNCLY